MKRKTCLSSPFQEKIPSKASKISQNKNLKHEVRKTEPSKELSLRRATTLTVEDPESPKWSKKTSETSISLKQKSLKPNPSTGIYSKDDDSSLAKPENSNLTKGSNIGQMYKIPSGLTKLAFTSGITSNSLNMSDLIDPVDDTEMAIALASLEPVATSAAVTTEGKGQGKTSQVTAATSADEFGVRNKPTREIKVKADTIQQVHLENRTETKLTKLGDSLCDKIDRVGSSDLNSAEKSNVLKQNDVNDFRTKSVTQRSKRAKVDVKVTRQSKQDGKMIDKNALTRQGRVGRLRRKPKRYLDESFIYNN